MYPDGLIFGDIDVEIVLDYSIKGLTLAISLRVVGSQHTPLNDLYCKGSTPRDVLREVFCLVYSEFST